MLERPEIRDDALLSRLNAAYGIPASAVEFLPVGNDSGAWVYRVDASNGESYFLKVKQGTVDETSLAVPRYLRDSGIAQVVAPLPTLIWELSTNIEGFTLLLYPFIAGRNGMEAGLSGEQWTQFGDVLKRIHTVSLPPELAGKVRSEDFIPPYGGLVRGLDGIVRKSPFGERYRRELASFWADRREEILRLVLRTEELGRLLRARPAEFVLCHSDIHTANLLVDPDGGLHIVDWDAPQLAPRERDLMFVTGVGSFEEERFFRGYGRTETDPLAMAYYRYEWVVQEIGDYGERVFLKENAGEETIRHAVGEFKGLFQSGDVVESAYRAEENLAP